MSVRQGLLALLAVGPMYGAQLRSEFERRTGGTWPLNVGQVYQTLTRLERDGMVSVAGEPDDEGKIAYRITDAGLDEVTSWWANPVDRTATPRDELVIKLALAVTVPDVDIPRIVQTQRTSTMRHLQELTRLKRNPAESVDPAADLTWKLLLENHIYAAEAEVRWLDHVESAVARAAERGTPASVSVLDQHAEQTERVTR